MPSMIWSPRSFCLIYVCKVSSILLSMLVMVWLLNFSTWLVAVLSPMAKVPDFSFLSLVSASRSKSCVMAFVSSCPLTLDMLMTVLMSIVFSLRKS